MMNTFNVADFLANDGAVVIAGTYTETFDDAGKTIIVVGASKKLAVKTVFKYTFWLLRFPIREGYYELLKNFTRGKLL